MATARQLRNERLDILEAFIQPYLEKGFSLNKAIDLHNANCKKQKDLLVKDTIYYWTKDVVIRAKIDGWKAKQDEVAINTVTKHMAKDPRVAQWWLEKRDPEFRNKQTITIDNLNEDPEQAKEAEDILSKLNLG